MILLTVAIAVATFVSALALRESVEQTAILSYRALSGASELEATFSEKYTAYYLTEDGSAYRDLKEAAEKYGELHAGYLFYASIGKEKGEFAEVYATDWSDLEKYNPLSLLSGESKNLRTGVVLGEAFAEKIGARVGDSLTATRYGAAQKVTLTVVGIAERKGIFSEVDVLLSEEKASTLLSFGESVRVYNRFFIDLSEEKMNSFGVSEAQATADLQSYTDLFEIGSPVNDRQVASTLTYQSTLLFVIALIVAALGAILIYTAVSLVMKERVSVASLFKSVGATSGGLTLYLLAEILLYGLVGSAIGVAGSYGVSAIFRALTGSVAIFAVGWLPVVLGFLFGVSLSLLSALIPVLRLAFSSLYDMLRAHSPILRAKKLPAIVVSAIFLAFFLWTSFASVSSAFTVGIFAFIALMAFLFAVTPFAIKGISCLLCRVTRDKPKAGKLYLAASGAKNNRHAQSAARLLAIAITAVVTIAVLLGEATRQLRAFDGLFSADIMISAGRDEIEDIAAATAGEEGVDGAYVAYVETRCAVEGTENTVSFFAARSQEYEEVFHASDFGVDVASLRGARKAAMGGGLALKLGLSVGDTFVVTVDGVKREFVLASLIDTPLTVIFTELSGLGVAPNLCLAKGSEEAFNRLSEKYALQGAVYRAEDAFGYVTDLASAYIKVFTLFELLVILFAAAGYLNGALASFRDRKREHELLSSAGASRGDLRRLILAENAIVILTALLAGAALSVALIYIVQNMLKSLGLYFPLLG